jgi:hypothetical protein
VEPVTYMGETKNSFKIVLGKPQKKRHFGKPWNKWAICLVGFRKIDFDVVKTQ